MEFEKYLKDGAYHWDATSVSLSKHVAFTAGRYQAILERPLAWKGSRILDIASGDCRLAAFVAEAGASLVVAVDASRVGVTVGRARWLRERPGTVGRAAFVQGDAMRLPLREKSFDIVLASEIIEHLENPRDFLASSARMVRPGGCLVVTTPMRLTDRPLDPFHVREYFPSELEPMAREFFRETEVTLTHPAWVTSLYTLRGWAWPFRILVNFLSVAGSNPFLRWPLGRYAAQITLVARQPKS